MDIILSLSFVPQAHWGARVGVCRLRTRSRAVYARPARDLCVVARCEARFLFDVRIDIDVRRRALGKRSAFSCGCV